MSLLNNWGPNRTTKTLNSTQYVVIKKGKITIYQQTTRLYGVKVNSKLPVNPSNVKLQ